MRAMAHPVRLALMEALNDAGTLTATEAAERVGESPSNCSFHLRQLAKYGLAERAPGADGRERPWRATATGLSYGQGEADLAPGAAEAALALDEMALARAEELTREARRRNDRLRPEWRSAEAYHDFGLRLTASELAELTGRIDDLVRPYIAMTRRDPPDDAEVALLRLLAFRYPEAP